MSVKDLFEEHKWLLWLVAALAIFASGALCAVWLNARNAGDIRAPVDEITITKEASRKIGETIVEAQKQRDRLPEVVKSAKNNVMHNIADADDACIADCWNGLLGRYRESRTSAGGL